MLTTRVIPCLDVKNGRIVKGIKFQGLRDAGDPVARAAQYQADGADELVILDVSATLEERRNNLETVAAVRKVLSIPLSVGGGVRTAADAEALLLAGADKVAINTAAIANPTLISELAQRFGSQCTILAVDAKQHGENSWRVVTHSGKNVTELDVIDWIVSAEKLGAGEILLTSWDRDGTRSGYDLALLSAVSTVSHIPIIASGGADSVNHMLQAIAAGADAVLAASIFHDGDHSVSSVKQALLNNGVAIRT